MLFRKVLVSLGLLSALMWAVPLHGAAIDSTLVTYYNIGTNRNMIYLSVCGSLPNSTGCYGAASMGPFGRIGSMIEGIPQQNVNAGTVTRYIYVVDVAYGSGGDGVELSVYKKVDAIAGSSDTVTVSLYKTVNLSLLTGGSTAKAFLAANTEFLFVGTNKNGKVVSVKKSNLQVSPVANGNQTLSSITANNYGFISLVWGTGEFAQFEIVEPDGIVEFSGAPASFVQNTIQGAVPSMLP